MDARQEQALDLVLEVTTLLADDMRRAFERDGLTPARAHLLWLLQQHGPTSQRELADALRVTPRTVTGLVDGLESSGLVARRPHPTDRRSTLVTFTDAGARIADEMATGKAQLAEGLFGDLPAQRLAGLVAGLADVRDRLARLVAEDLAGRGSVAP
ncbi:MAG TPA: MarR family transcriptional regulator [Acidimicrobiales bacterium]|nr:MarR family transcriptional regulator [Acidimicrobiales bacterium]